MGNQFEIRFGGSGGQGMMILGDIFADAAGIKEGKEVLLTKSYGPESRGGACRSELIISDSYIDYPVVTRPNFMLSMSQLSFDSYSGDLADGAKVLIDEELVKHLPEDVSNIYSLPLTKIARDVTGKEVAANLVAVGAIAILSGCVSVESAKKAVDERFDEAFRESNERAFNAGVEAAKALMGQ